MNYLENKSFFLLPFVRYSIIMYPNSGKGGIVAVGEVIAVLSGKGGTGKTSVCAGVSASLAKTGLKVLCIDLDIGLRNLDIPLGIADRGALSFLDVSEGGYSLEQATRHPIYPSMTFLTAPLNRSAERIDFDAFGTMLRDARKIYDYIFLDAPAGLDAGFRLAAVHADRCVLVTGPDPASIRDACRTSDVLDIMGKREVRLVINRVNPKMAAALKLTMDDIIDETGIRLLGLVPEDVNVLLAASYGVPLPEQSNKGAAAACGRIAKRIQGIPEPINIR